MELINILVTTLHILSALLLIIAVLLQSGKGGGLAGLGGGSTAAATQMFGGGGAGNFLSRGTVILATLFMASSLTIAYIAAKPNSAMDLTETAGGVSSQEDPILEEGTGPLTLLDGNAQSAAEAPLKIEPMDSKTIKLDLGKDDSAQEMKAKIDHAVKAVEENVDKKEDLAKTVKKTTNKVEKKTEQAAKAVTKTAKKVEKKTEQAAKAVKNTADAVKDTAKKVEDTAKANP